MDNYHYFLNGYTILFLLNALYTFGKLYAYFQRKYPLSAMGREGADARDSLITSCLWNFTLYFPLLVSPGAPFYNAPYAIGALVASYIVVYFLFGKNKYGFLFW